MIFERRVESMSFYYGIYVKSGTEITTTKKLQLLNNKMGGHLFNSVFVPFKETEVYNLQCQTLEKKYSLLFNSYIFIQTNELLTSEQYNIIKQCSSSIYKILLDVLPVEETEQFLRHEQATLTDVVFQPKDNLIELIGKIKDVIRLQYNRRNSYRKYIKFINKNNLSRITLTRQTFLAIAKKLQITVKDLLYNPVMFFEELLEHYRTGVINKIHSFNM